MMLFLYIKVNLVRIRMHIYLVLERVSSGYVFEAVLIP